MWRLSDASSNTTISSAKTLEKLIAHCYKADGSRIKKADIGEYGVGSIVYKVWYVQFTSHEVGMDSYGNMTNPYTRTAESRTLKPFKVVYEEEGKGCQKK